MPGSGRSAEQPYPSPVAPLDAVNGGQPPQARRRHHHPVRQDRPRPRPDVAREDALTDLQGQTGEGSRREAAQQAAFGKVKGSAGLRRAPLRHRSRHGDPTTAAHPMKSITWFLRRAIENPVLQPCQRLRGLRPGPTDGGASHPPPPRLARTSATTPFGMCAAWHADRRARRARFRP
jgi:hypothetical protein